MKNDKEVIKEAIREVITEQKTEFYIDREEHYEHHRFIGEMMCWADKVKSTALKTIVRTIVYAALVLLVLGFCYKWKGL